MSYNPPAGNTLELQFGTGYTPPVGDALVLQFAPSGAPSLSFAAALTVTGGLDLTYSLPTYTLAIDAALSIDSDLDVRHGVTGAMSADLDIGADVALAHGVAGAFSTSLSIDGSAALLHPRFRLHGQVKDNGVLVDRRVRAYRRSTGALVAEVDTVDGEFELSVGYSVDEFYLVPIDLDNAASDWRPPVANRVLSVLVSD